MIEKQSRSIEFKINKFDKNSINDETKDIIEFLLNNYNLVDCLFILKKIEKIIEITTSLMKKHVSEKLKINNYSTDFGYITIKEILDKNEIVEIKKIIEDKKNETKQINEKYKIIEKEIVSKLTNLKYKKSIIVYIDKKLQEKKKLDNNLKNAEIDEITYYDPELDAVDQMNEETLKEIRDDHIDFLRTLREFNGDLDETNEWYDGLEKEPDSYDFD